MTSASLLAMLALATVVLPALQFGLVATLEVLGRLPADRRLAALARWTFLSSTLCGIAAAVLWIAAGGAPVHRVLGHWFALGEADGPHYGFDFGVLVDATSLTYLLLTSTLCGVVGAFSLRYLEGERGAGRFFQAMMLFAASLSLVVVADSLDLVFVGWELVGISSMLLIAFYRQRSEPIHGALAAFSIYRVCDVGLLAAMVVLHHVSGSGSLADLGSATELTGAALPLGLLLTFAALGKSAQFPFSGWLPRAMEGPTPSSAIFYGALSVHAGAYLLLRTAPLWQASTLVAVTIVVIGTITALTGTLVGRAQTDAKSALAYATVTQVGLIFIEIGLGWHTLALVHVAGHATVRTLELLRAPSLLADHQRLEAELGAPVPATGRHYERLLPPRWQQRLYALALGRCGLDAVAARLVAGGARVLRRLDAVDRWLASSFDGESTEAGIELPERMATLASARIDPLVGAFDRLESDQRRTARAEDDLPEPRRPGSGRRPARAAEGSR